MSALGNSANLVSSAVGRRDFASLNTASTSGVDEVLRDQLYYMNRLVSIKFILY